MTKKSTQEEPGRLADSTPIAVVGYACRLPGEATSPSAFLKMLAEGRAAWSEVPENRYNVDAYWHPDTNRIGTTVARGAHWMKQNPKVFDAPMGKVSMTGAEASALDPQLRMLLEVVYECLEDSGIPIHEATGSNTSVFVGSSSSEYGGLESDDIENVPLYAAVGTGVSMLANRISYFYNLVGPSVALDTACSSGLVSVHLGCQSLRTGESRMSLVAASQIMLRPDGPVCLSRLGFLSPDSRCYTFDDRANGYARGEGICVLACKRLDDALADGDTIRAVIRGTASNHDGRTPGIVQPNPAAQAALIRATYKAAGLDPMSTQYFEAHGTGTRLGDPIEVKALAEALKTAERPEDNPLFIGSVKTNIGHLEGGAGMVGLLKAILSVENRVIFPNLNYENPNPRLPLKQWRLKVPTELTAWPSNSLVRASVNSFGYGGTNAHCIIDNAFQYLQSCGLHGNTTKRDLSLAVIASLVDIPNDVTLTNGNKSQLNGANGVSELKRVNGLAKVNGASVSEPKTPKLFVLSSPEKAGATRIALRYAEYLASRDDSEKLTYLDNLAYTLAARRSQFQWRIALVADSFPSLQRILSQPTEAVRARTGQTDSLLFVFTGQGAQHFAMGRELLDEPVFAASVYAADKFLATALQADWSVLKELRKPENKSRVNSARFSQPLCTILQIALVDMFRSWGVEPAAVVGHSSGEIAAAYAAQYLSAEDSWTIAYFRGLLSDEITCIAPELDGVMGMMAVGLSGDDIKPYLPAASEKSGDDTVVVACFNAPQSVTLSGSRQALTELEDQLKANGIFARQLAVDIAYHSPYMKLIAQKYLDALEHIRPMADRSPIATVMISTVTGAAVASTDLGAEYWVKNLTSPVRFAQALQHLLPVQAASARRRKADKVTIDTVLEFGPHAALQGPLKQILTKQGYSESISYSPVQIRGKNAHTTALQTAAHLWSHGFSINLVSLNTPSTLEPPRVLENLPSYPWNHSTEFWYETTSESKRLRTHARHDFVGVPSNPALEWKWRNFLRIKENPWLADYQVSGKTQLSPMTLLSAVIEACRQISGARNSSPAGLELTDVSFHHPVSLDDSGVELYTELVPFGKFYEHRDAVTTFQFQIFTVVNQELRSACTGGVAIQHEGPQMEAHSDQEQCDLMDHVQEVAPEQFYAGWVKRGLRWGPQFQLLGSVKSRHNAASVRVNLKDTKDAMPAKFQFDHIVHPTTLDACVQSTFAALPQASHLYQLKSIKSLTVPLGLSKAPGSLIVANSTLNYTGFGCYTAGFEASQGLSDPSKIIVGHGLQLHCDASEIDAVARKKPMRDVKKVASNFYWKPDIDKMSPTAIESLFLGGGLVLTRPIAQDDKMPRERSIPGHQINAVPDLVPWRAYTAKLLELCGHKSPDQSILEIARGAEDFSAKALDVLGGKNGGTPLCSKYSCFVPPGVRFDQREYFPWKHFFELNFLDILNDGKFGSVEAASIDVIIISAPLQPDGTKQLLELCNHALRPGGRLVICQAGIRARAMLTSKLLRTNGFRDLPVVLPFNKESRSGPSTMLLTKGCSPKRSNSDVVIALPKVVSSDLHGFVSSLVQQLRIEGVHSEVYQWEALSASLAGKAVISLLEIDEPFIYDLDEERFAQIQRFFANGSAGGLWVTRGNMYLDPSGDPRFHATTGLIRCMRNEKHESKFTELALSHRRPLNRSFAVDLAVSVFKDVFEAESMDATAETEVGELNEVPHIVRLYDEPLKNRRLDLAGSSPSPESVPLLQSDRQLRLEVGDPKSLESLRFVHGSAEEVTIQDDDDVIIDLKAHGVRSLESLTQHVGLLEDKLGLDASGVIVDYGRNVGRFRRGERVVVSIPGAYATRVRSHQDNVAKMPQGMPFTEAATLPSLMLAAHHILFNICRLRKEDSVLIDAETPLSFTLAQLAKASKATVFIVSTHEDEVQALGTAAGLPSCQLLAGDEASIIRSVRSQTEDQGVTISIFNGGQRRSSSFAQRCRSAFGKSIALIHDSTVDTTGIETASNSVTCSIPSILHSIYADATYLRRLMASSRHYFENGSIQPPSSCATFSYSAMVEAFELAARRPNDRIALQLGAADTVSVVPQSTPPLRCDPEATYLVLGGFGGLGRWLCNKLADHGARNIATFSRSGPSTPEAKECIAALQKRGIRVCSYRCDVADSSAFKAAVDSLQSEMPRIRGAIHATMVLHDEYLIDLTHEKWAAASRNKIQGGLNMHTLLPQDMDFLVMISSASAIMGNGMQSNYATGNAFLDGLAVHRRHLGLAASAVNFGVITEIGFVAERVTFDSAHVADFTLNSISPPEVWDCLESGMTGFLHLDEPMPPQLVTCSGSGGIFEQLKHIKTFLHMADPKYKYIIRLDASGGEDSYSTIRKGRKELSKQLEASASFNEALGVVEAALVEKVAAAIPMLPSDVDPARPVSEYGIDSLLANEIRNWAFSVVKGTISASEILSMPSITQLAERLTRRSQLVMETLKTG